MFQQSLLFFFLFKLALWLIFCELLCLCAYILSLEVFSLFIWILGGVAIFHAVPSNHFDLCYEFVLWSPFFFSGKWVVPWSLKDSSGQNERFSKRNFKTCTDHALWNRKKFSIDFTLIRLILNVEIIFSLIPNNFQRERSQILFLKISEMCILFFNIVLNE